MGGEWRKPLHLPTWLGGVIPLCALGLAFGPDQFPLVTIRAFLIPLAGLLFLAAMWMLKMRSAWVGGGTILAALLLLLPPARVLFQGSGEGRSEALLSIAQMNIHEANTSVAEVVSAARASEVDVLSVQEVDELWRDQLVADLSDQYPWHMHGAGERNYGIALFSKIPLEQVGVMDLEGLPMIRAKILHRGVRIQVYAVHLRSPESPAHLAQRNKQWPALARMVRTTRDPICLIGDLNTVPWDDAFLQYLASTAMRGGPRSLIPTWPAIAGAAVLPLDHILISSELSLVGIHTFSIPGSDHRGIQARIQTGNACP